MVKKPMIYYTPHIKKVTVFNITKNDILGCNDPNMSFFLSK